MLLLMLIFATDVLKALSNIYYIGSANRKTVVVDFGLLLLFLFILKPHTLT